MQLTRDDIASALGDVLAHYDVREAYLLGSFAREEQSPSSDIDLRFVCTGAAKISLCAKAQK